MIGLGQNMNDDRTDLLGLRISAGLLVVLGCLFAIYVAFFGLLLGVSVVRRWEGRLPASDKPSSLLSLLIVVAMTAALTISASALQRRCTMLAVGALTLPLGSGCCFYCSVQTSSTTGFIQNRRVLTNTSTSTSEFSSCRSL